MQPIFKERASSFLVVSFSNLAEIHKSSLKAAIEDSRAKAEILAECTGKKMLGIKKDDMNFRNHRDVVYEEREFAACACAVEPSLADKLKAPTTEESEEIEVIWLIES